MKVNCNICGDEITDTFNQSHSALDGGSVNIINRVKTHWSWKHITVTVDGAVQTGDGQPLYRREGRRYVKVAE